MKQETINLTEILKDFFPTELVKDLQDNERICPTCKGLGITIRNNEFGIEGDNSAIGKTSLFPYKQQSFSFCPSCYNGVQKLCPYCKKPYKYQGVMHCDCETQKKLDEENQMEHWNTVVEQAAEVQEKDIDTMLYCVELDHYYWDSEEFMDDWNSENHNNDKRPERLWLTEKYDLHIDAETIIEQACEEMYEDAIDNISMDAQDELQSNLDDWCAKQQMSSYYPDYNRYVCVPWSEQ